MNKQIKILWDVVDSIVKNSKYVKPIQGTTHSIYNAVSGIKSQPEKISWDLPSICKLIGDEAKRDFIIQYEGFASSVNYQYWYGRADIRPNGANANKMYQLLDEACLAACKIGQLFNSFEVGEEFIKLLTLNRFPLLEKRIKHIREVINSGIIIKLQDNCSSLDKCMELLLLSCPGFADDIFLKRACLLFMMLYRSLGLFSTEINDLPIPADYQIPKMLEGLGCIQYIPELKDMIENEVIIPSGSRIECEIRAVSIFMCKKLAEMSERNSSDVDNWLWLKRKEITSPFHLTVTSHY
jgi:hypothetical protein